MAVVRAQMMLTKYNRKTSPKVIGGHVLRKNNHKKTARRGYVVDRYRPAKGFKHFMKKKDVHDFTDIIPEWEIVSEGIESIILDSGDTSYDGLYKHYGYEGTGVIWLSAWEENLWVDLNNDYFIDHQWILEKLGVYFEEKDKEWVCHFTESQAKAFMLLHIFLHELGHHIDKMRSKNKNVIRGGEEFAERYANETFLKIWPDYVSKFGIP
jgi:hypothetical protein